MASTNTLQVIENGFRNVVLRATQVSDGTDGESVTVFNATSSGSFGVNKGGQVFYPGIYTKLVGLWYDVQDCKVALRWEATADQDVLVLGQAPEDFDFRSFGGVPVPSGLVGATGSLKVVTLGPVVGATYSMIIRLRKNVPQS